MGSGITRSPSCERLMIEATGHTALVPDELRVARQSDSGVRPWSDRVICRRCHRTVEERHCFSGIILSDFTAERWRGRHRVG
jgi:hypothetical protein